MESHSAPTSTTSSHVAQLAGARMPADHGLTGLGLLMQLGGSIFLVYGAYLALLPLLENVSGGPRLEMFFIGVASTVRSAFHRSAGGALLYGSAKGPVHQIKVYIGVAATQSIGVALFLSNMDLPFKLVLFFFVVLMAWPATLAIVMRTRRFKSIGSDVPKAEDMGFEAAAVLMTIFGVMGSMAMGLLILTVFKTDVISLREVPSLLWVAVMLMLLVRSLLHARAGLQGTSGVNAERASESASRYFNFGVMVSVIAGAVLMLQMLMMQATMHFAMFTTVAMAVYLLLVWPLALRNFFTDRNFSMLLDDTGFTRRAPDTGLTALGWMLVATGVISLSFSLGAVLFLKGRLMGVDVMLLSKMVGGPGTHSLWWSIGVAGLQLAAGLELISMTDRHRILSSAYGAVAILVTFYLWWPLIKDLKDAGAFDPFNSMQLYGQLMISLTLPIATLLLVNRHTAPDAQARISEARPTT